MRNLVLRGLWIMIFVLILMGIPSVLLFSDVSFGTADPHQIILSSRDDPRTTQTITWRMDFDADRGQLQHVEHNEKKPFPYDVRTVTAKVEKISTHTENLSIHSVTLQRLKPGTRYHYRVGYGNVWSEWYSFTTADGNL
ncbi:fibronectin type III domain-containing protein [Pelosinus sp. sgz500959]|uniref:fibronectin type III domain-containing protein n=1 Tax=Pelosinus sp. sgz500959 TaxID=3242472 RepID=UPI00367129EB